MRHLSLAVACVAALVVGACHSSPTSSALLAEPLPKVARPAQPVAVQQPGVAARSAAAPNDNFVPPAGLGTVAGRSFDAEELLVELYGLLGRDLLMVVDRLVAAKLAETEAARLGLRLDVETAEVAVADARADLMADFRVRFPLVPYEEVVRKELGVRPEVHTRRLREATIRRLLTERVIRATTLARETADVHLVVSATRAEATARLKLIAAGATFEEVAETTDEGSTGGRVPFLVNDERSPLARAVFLLADGEVGGPFEVEDRFVLARLASRRPALEGRWNTIGAEVEASLAADPIEESEYLSWHLAMEERYEVDLAPIAALLGLASGDLPRDED